MECFSYVSRQILCFLGQGSSGFLSLTPRVPRLAHMPSDLLGAAPLQQHFSFGFFSIDSWVMLLSLHSFLSPPFPSSFPKSDPRLLCFLEALSPWPGAPAPHSPAALLPSGGPSPAHPAPHRPGPSLHPGGLRALRVALRPLLLASGWPEAGLLTPEHLHLP